MLAVLSCVLLPQVMALVGDATDFFSKDIVLALRFMAVALLFYVCLHATARAVLDLGLAAFFKTGQARVYALYFLMVCWVLLSLTVNRVSLHDFERAGIFFVFAASMLVFMPAVLRRLDSAAVSKSLSYGFLALALGLVVLAVGWRWAGLNENNRFGFPLSPGVFACYMMTAWAVSYSVLRNRYLSILFFWMVVIAGSRSAIAITAFLYVIAQSDFSAARLASMFRGGLIVLAGLAAIYCMDTNIYRPYTIERSDLFSGRTEIWEKSLDQMQVRDYIFGQGKEVRIVRKRGARVGAHNSFLNLSMLYGLPFALMAFGLWFLRFMPPGVLDLFRAKMPLALLQQQIFIMVTLKSMVGNVFWTNMGDAATLAGCLFLLLRQDRDGAA